MKHFVKLMSPESSDPKGKRDKEAPPATDGFAEKTKSENEDHKGKSLKEKVKDALQEWSNDNERDIEEDNSTPLRSGL